MRGAWTRLRAALSDRPVVRFCDACASVTLCDTACRVTAARDLVTTG